MKQIKNIVIMLAILISITGMADAVTITGLSDVSTTDTTPAFDFSVTGNQSSYDCTLWIDGIASGSVTATNATETTITCNRTLETGSYTYNVSAYNSTETPITTYSSDYTLEITTMFSGVVDVIDAAISIFDSLVDLIIAVVPLIIVMAVVGGIVLLIRKVLGRSLGGGL